MKKVVAFHPLLFAAYAVLAMYANNLGQVAFTDVRRALLVCVLTAGLLLVLMRLLFRDWGRAAIVTTLALILFFSYGHFYSWIKTFAFGRVVGRHRYLLPLSILLLVGLSWILMRSKERRRSVNRFFNVVSGVILIFPLISTVGFGLQANYANRFLEAEEPSASPQISAAAGNPDVYYIILDGYARADILAELYGFDNSEFLDFLRDRGFTVAGKSTSNYMQTHLSMSSALNMKYLDDLAAQIGARSTNVQPLGALYSASAVRRNFEALGYQIVAFEHGYGMLEMRDADLFMTSYDVPVGQASPFFLEASVNAFESQLIESTAIRAALDLYTIRQESIQQAVIDPAYQLHRNRILYTFEHLPDIAAMEGDYFVMAHIVAPHPPFVFGPNGEEVYNTRGYSMADGDFYVGTPEYVEGYLNQLIYVNKLAERMITQILEASSTPPVIILQSDHGPGSQLIWESADDSLLRERMSILNAYYLPGNVSDAIYPSITPVNSFRVIFDLYFSAQYELLADQNYFSTASHPYDFIEVTDRVQD
jgi:hypothetical protein